MSVLAQVDLHRAFPRKFVPREADAGDWAQIEPVFSELLRRAPSSPEELEKWLADYCELVGAVDEEETRRYISMTLQTDDPAREAAYQQFVENINPKIKPLVQAWEKAYLQNRARKLLPRDRYAVLDRIIDNNVALFREENVPLETEEALLKKDYQKLAGAMTVIVNGTEQTLQQAARYLEEPDRGLRQQVWEQIAKRRLLDKQKLEELYDRLVALRTRIAANAGFSNYRDYIFRRYQRFDYTPEDCFRFHDGVERAVLPLAAKILKERQRLLRVDTLRPWDLEVDPLHRPPLRPFSTTGELVKGTREIFTRVDPAFGEQFQFIADHQLLDIESRKGKAPGGYQSMLSECRVPFIFTNAVGRDVDVRTLLHEGGHAFHTFAARNDPVIYYRYTTAEFREVASMSMEMFALPHLAVFYKDPKEYRRACRSRLENLALMLPVIAMGDAFQHWVYTRPAHTSAERAQAWKEIQTRFTVITDWTGHEEQRAYAWHRILHFFEVPFYSIEYALAEIGALQVWTHSRSNYHDAVERYWSALSLGGSRPLPQLFEAAGAHFRFDYEVLKPLMDALGEEIDSIGS